MKIAIIGASGRMGRAIIEEINLHPDCELSGGLVKKNSEFSGIDLGALAGMEPIGINTSESIENIVESCDSLIDFSNPRTSLECAEIAAGYNKIFVSGTTGFSEKELGQLESYGKQTQIIWSANMSIGINLLKAMVEKTAGILDNNFDIEIVEMHHCRKVDAPSGTALLLGEAAAEGRKVQLDSVARKSREGLIGPRPEGEIGFSTIRGGDVVGEHTVIFAGDGERIELTHKASDRKIFAKGSVRAALWAKQKPSGFYSMKDVLNANSG